MNATNETVAEYGIKGERALDARSIFRLLQPLIGNQAQEVFCALILDGGIPLLDHVILGADSCVSLRARGVLT